MIAHVPRAEAVPALRRLAGRLFLPMLLLAGFDSQAYYPIIPLPQLASLPDREGFAAPFAGVAGGALLVAGGANFPDKKPWDGGTKVWHDTVFVLEKPDGQWKTAGKLPRPLGYGVSVSADDSVLCFGGSDAARHYDEGFRLRWKKGVLTTTPLPALPKPCANMAWALADNRTLYVVGGIEKPDSTHCLRSLWALDLKRMNEGWRELGACPGPARMLAVAAGHGKDLLLFSGAGLTAGPDGRPQRSYLYDAWRFSPGRGWIRLPDLPCATVAAPSPAPVAGQRVFIFSGDDGTKATFQPLSRHPGFPRAMLEFDAKKDRWLPLSLIRFSLATVPVVKWRDDFILPGGETRPGVRTPEVWTFRPPR